MHVSGVYSWTQTKKSIDISIPLKGVSPKKIDILLTETYIKVSYRPFLLEIDLFKAVDEVSSRAVLKSGTLIIHLRKKDDESGGDWDSICFEGTKKEIQLRRSQAMSNREELVKIVHNKAKDRQIEEGRIVLRKQMDLERKERELIDERKDREKVEAEKAVYETLAKFNSDISQGNKCSSTDEKLRVVVEHVSSDNLSSELAVNQPHSSQCTEKNTIQDSSFSSHPHDTSPDNSLFVHLPEPRQSVRALIKHTSRLFKTPSRESTIEQENLFILKNRPHLASNKLLNRDGLDISENDPIWLQEKGDKFLENGDFASGIQAYSIALEVDSSRVLTLSKRAICYFQRFEWLNSLQDCTKGLTLIGDDETHETDLYCLRGKVYCHLGNFENAISDYKKVCNLNPQNPRYKNDLEKIYKLMKAFDFKKKADELSMKGKFNDSLQLYNKSTEEVPVFFNSLSNRSACFLALEKFKDCIKSCCEAINSLETISKSQDDILNDIYCAAAPRTKKEYKSCLSRLLLRRGIAKARILEYTESLYDLNKAMSFLEPNSKEWLCLQGDIETIKNRMSTASE